MPSNAEPGREHLAHGVDGLPGAEALVAERLPGAEVDHGAHDRAICGAAPTVPPASVVPPENLAEIVLRHGNELLAG